MGFGKATKAVTKGDKKKRKGKRKESYAIYICKVLKQVHPDTGVSSKAMSMISSSASLLRLASLLTTIRGLPSPRVRSRLLFVSFCQESWLSMLFLKAPRQSPSTQARSRLARTVSSCDCHSWWHYDYHRPLTFITFRLFIHFKDVWTWQGWQHQDQGEVQIQQGRTSVPCWSHPQAPEERQLCQESWSWRPSLHGCCDGVPCCRDP